MSKNKISSELVEKKDIAQAVLIADNFNDNFHPFSTELPIALFPFVNQPLIDYALESLSLGGIEETFLFCCSHVDKIKSHIDLKIKEKARWTVQMKVNVIVSESCRSLGDALRDLDAKGLLRGNFILLNADTVSNINFMPILQKHNLTCKKDKGTAMTLIFLNSGSHRSAQSSLDDILIASNKDNRILFHQKGIQSNYDKKINFPLETFLENSQVRILNNLRDTYISICSPSVLPLFSDNFDFQTKDDFVRGLLMNEEILSSTLYWHKLSGKEYAARISNWNSYQYVTHDLIHRWVYPLVPDMGISSQQQTYVYRRNNIYKHRDVKLAKGSKLLEDIVIGKGSVINESSVISSSIIGDNCKIGKNVKINNSYILSNTVIKDDCIISYSFIGRHCNIGKKSKISLGSILGSKVRTDDGAILEGVIVQAEQPLNCNLKDKISSHCYLLSCESKDEENSDSEEDKLSKQLNRFYLGNESSDSDLESDVSSLSDDEMSHMASPVPDDTNLFLIEVSDSLTRGFEDKLPCDNLILEINSSRYAYNVTVREVNYNVVKAIFLLPLQFGHQSYLSSLLSLLTYFSPILKNYIRNEDAMHDCLLAVKDTVLNYSQLEENVVKIVKWFYDKDLLDEDEIIQWYFKLEQNSSIYTKLEPLINWLKEADEESSESS